MNEEIGTEAGAIPRKGIHKWDFCCSVVNHFPCGAGRWEEDAVVATVATTHLRIGERTTGILKCKQRSHFHPSFLTLFYTRIRESCLHVRIPQLQSIFLRFKIQAILQHKEGGRLVFDGIVS
jgi:hypothetical protein